MFQTSQLVGVAVVFVVSTSLYLKLYSTVLQKIGTE